MPVVLNTPLLQKKGDVEVTAGLRNIVGFEGAAAWSPAPHLMVVAEGASQSGSGSETRNDTTFSYRNVQRQGGLGLGTYWLVGEGRTTHVAAIGGVGLTKADIYDKNFEGLFIFIPIYGPLVRYQANYLRYFGQVQVVQQGSLVSYGVSVRGTLLDYSRLLRNGVPIAPPTRFFLQPTLLLRVGRGAVQGQATFGVSIPGRANRDNPDNGTLAPSPTLLGLGVVLRPHLLWHPAPALPPQ